MEIQTKRLVLRPIGMQDLKTTHTYSADKENTKYMAFLPNESIDETKDFLEKCENEWHKDQPCFYEFAVVADGNHIGGIGVYLHNANDTAELGWILDKKYHGMGYATEAAGAVIGFAEDRLSIKHFVAHCDWENRASQNVMSKLGFFCAGCANGRKNRGSSEERKEMTFELYV
jgi:RimJ/RimL family protein N-acetyltransferase